MNPILVSETCQQPLPPAVSRTWDQRGMSSGLGALSRRLSAASRPHKNIGAVTDIPSKWRFNQTTTSKVPAAYTRAEMQTAESRDASEA